MSDIMSYFNNPSFVNAVEVLQDNLDKKDEDYNLEKIVHMVSILYDNGLIVDNENTSNDDTSSGCDGKCDKDNKNSDNVNNDNDSFDNADDADINNDDADSDEAESNYSSRENGEPVEDFVALLGNSLKNVFKDLNDGNFTFFKSNTNDEDSNTSEQPNNPFYNERNPQSSQQNKRHNESKLKYLKDAQNEDKTEKKNTKNLRDYVDRNLENKANNEKPKTLKNPGFAKVEVTQDEYIKVDKAAEMLGLTLEELIFNLAFTSRIRTYRSPVTGALYLRKNDVLEYLEDL